MITPVFRLSGTMRWTAPPKNSKASTWLSTQDCSSIESTGRKNMRRLKASTMMKPCTLRQRSATGSNQRPSNP